MTAKTKSLDFYSVAVASQAPTGNYTTAREMLDDLPAAVMQLFGKDGACVANYMVKRYGNEWHRSDRQWFEPMVPFAANALLRHPNLSPDQRMAFEVMALIGGVFDAVDKKKSPWVVIEIAGIPAAPKQAQPAQCSSEEAKQKKLRACEAELTVALDAEIDAGRLPRLNVMHERFKPEAAAMPNVVVKLAPLTTNDPLIAVHQCYDTIAQEGGVA
jgi:hypothetical protein